jgi:hypothetical protein
MIVYISEQSSRFEYEEVDQETFEEALLDLATLDLEDDQVGYPNFDKLSQSYLTGGRGYDLYMLRKDDLPSSGPFEIMITNDKDDEPIGFIRGTKRENIISFNLIHIMDEHRGYGIGSDIYIKLLNDGNIIKSDDEITDATYSLYKNLSKKYTTLLFNDGSVGLKKA